MCNEPIHAKKKINTLTFSTYGVIPLYVESKYKWRHEVAPECQMLPGGGFRREGGGVRRVK